MGKISGEDLAAGQVGGAGPGRGEEEHHHHPAGGQGDGRQHPGVEQQPGADQQHPRQHVRQGDHGPPPDGVEQVAEQHRPEHVPEGERDDVGGHDLVRDLEEGAQHQRLGEEHGVVEERLADEQRQPEHGALGVELEGGVGDLPEADAAALADLDRVGDLLQPLAGFLPDPPLDPVDQLLGLLVVAVDEHPAGALGDVAPDEQDAQAEDSAEAEGEAPAQVGGEQILVQQQQRQGGPEHRPEPERAVDDQVHPAAQPGRDELVHGRVDGRVLPADAGPGEEPAGVEVERVPGEGGGHGGHQVHGQGEHEQLLAPEPVGQVAEEQRPRQAPRT
jgi:hypothetical protein